uniref:Endonuclease n=1 Tax=Pithovirus LCPAC001 TaxID=2506585 RepID=A0A481Z3P1_9VIRU|nr:MAG: uncharacterized protein LCPAC001_00990 [Pithovirus LCPAC001]
MYQGKKSLNKKIEVCRSCYNKYTGYACRVEEQMVKYIQNSSLGSYIVLKDQIIKGDVCDTRRRPDLYIASTKKLHIIVECDEKQHQGYSEKCERGRLDEIIDEMREGRIVFIRWNPDYYQIDGKRGLVSRKERLVTLVEFIHHIISKNDWDENNNIVLYYMYYSNDRCDLENEFFVKHVYYKDDF